MGTIRKPLQGVSNIVRFNWHFYVLSAIFVLSVWLLNMALGSQYTVFATILTLAVCLPIIVSLSVSLYVYDLSGLYSLAWLKGFTPARGATIVNVNAGFDEMSASLHARYPDAKLAVFDFYNPKTHTEVSIERARKAYPPYPGTQLIITSDLPLANNSAELIFAILAAHEIRDEKERTGFFAELARAMAPTGRVIVTEHLRDLPNFLAYNIGFFHFLPRASWHRVFRAADLKVEQEISITPFITSFILRKDGIAS